MRQGWLKILLVNASIVLIIYILLMTDGLSSYSLIRFKSREGYVFDIRTDINWEQGRSIWCRIKHRKTSITTGLGTIVDYEPKELRFTFIEVNHFIAIIEISAPEVILLLFDTHTDHVATGTYSAEADKSIDKALLEEFKRLRSERSFVWSSDAYFDPRVKIH